MRVLSSLFVLLLVCWINSNAAMELDANLELAKFEDLTQCKICYYGFRCFFSANLEADYKTKSPKAIDDAVETHRKYKSGTGGETLQFEVISRCGSSSHQYFELVVTGVNATDVPQEKLEKKKTMFTKFPAFFTQDRATGQVGSVYLSRKDPLAARSIKKGLVRQLTKKIHPAAMQAQASSSSKTGSAGGGGGVQTTSYVFEGEDADGSFVAHHVAKRYPDSGIVELEENVHYLDKTKQKHYHPIMVDGSDIGVDLKKKKNCKSSIDSRGRVLSVSEKSNAKLGGIHHEPNNTAAVENTSPDLPEQKVVGKIDIAREGEPVAVSRCVNEALEDFEVSASARLGGSFHKTGLHDPISFMDIFGDHDETEDDNLIAHGNELLSDPVHLSALELRKCMKGDVATKTLMASAWDRYEAGKLNQYEMGRVVGALATVYSPYAYQTLLELFTNKDVDPHIRYAAHVSLLRAPGAPLVPNYVVNKLIHYVQADPQGNDNIDGFYLLGSMAHSHPLLAKAADVMVSSLHQTPSHNVQKLQAILGGIRNLAKGYSLKDAAQRIAVAMMAKAVAPHLDSWDTQVQKAASSAMERFPLKYREEYEDDSTGLEEDVDMGANNNAANADDESLAAAAGGISDVDMSLSIPAFKKVYYLIDHENVKSWVEGSCKVILSKNGSGVEATGILGGTLFTKSWSILKLVGKIATKGISTTLERSLDITLMEETVPPPNPATIPTKKVGVCPGTSQDPDGRYLNDKELAAMKKMDKNFEREFVRFPIPLWNAPLITADFGVGGKIGVALLADGSFGCTSPEKSGDINLVGGVLPYAGLSATAGVSASVGVAGTGADAKISLIDGSLPAYVSVTSSKYCYGLEYKLSSMSGKIELWGKLDAWVFSYEKRKTIFEWSGPAKTGSALEGGQSCSPMPEGIGQFLQPSDKSCSVTTANIELFEDDDLLDAADEAALMDLQMMVDPPAAAAPGAAPYKGPNSLGQLIWDDVKQGLKCALTPSNTTAPPKVDNSTSTNSNTSALAAQMNAQARQQLANATAQGNQAGAAKGRDSLAQAQAQANNGSQALTDASRQASERTRDQNTAGANRGTDQTNANAQQTGQAINNGQQQVQNTGNQQANANTQQVSQTGSQNRDTARDAAQQVQNNANTNAQSQSDATRRDGSAVNNALANDRGADRRDGAQTQQQLNQLQQSQQNQQQQQEIQRQSDRSAQTAQGVANQERRDEGRAQFASAGQNMQQNTQSTDNLMQRQNQNAQQQQQFDRSQDQQRREQATNTQQSQIQQFQNQLRRDNQESQDQNRRFDNIDQRLSSEQQQRVQREQMRGVSQDIGNAAAGNGQVTRDMNNLDQQMGNYGQSDAQQRRNFENNMNGQVNNQEQRQQAREQAERTQQMQREQEQQQRRSGDLRGAQQDMQQDAARTQQQQQQTQQQLADQQRQDGNAAMQRQQVADVGRDAQRQSAAVDAAAQAQQDAVQRDMARRQQQQDLLRQQQNVDRNVRNLNDGNRDRENRVGDQQRRANDRDTQQQAQFSDASDRVNNDGTRRLETAQERAMREARERMNQLARSQNTGLNAGEYNAQENADQSVDLN